MKAKQSPAVLQLQLLPDSDFAPAVDEPKIKRNVNSHRELCRLLLEKGNSCRLRMSCSGDSHCVVLDSAMSPVMVFSKYDYNRIEMFLKPRDKKKRQFLSLKKIRSLDGRHFLKKLYKSKLRSNVKESQPNS